MQRLCFSKGALGCSLIALTGPSSQPELPADSDVMVTDSEPVLEQTEHFALREKIIQGYLKDPWFADPANLTQLVSDQGLYWRQSAVVIPDHLNLRAELMHELHNTPCAGHLGVLVPCSHSCIKSLEMLP